MDCSFPQTCSYSSTILQTTVTRSYTSIAKHLAKNFHLDTIFIDRRVRILDPLSWRKVGLLLVRKLLDTDLVDSLEDEVLRKVRYSSKGCRVIFWFPSIPRGTDS